MHYLSLREVLIRNISGSHDQIIPANVPTFIIPKLYDAANAAGCVPCDEGGTVIQPAGSLVPSTEAVDLAAEVLAPSTVVPGLGPQDDVAGYTILDIKGVIEQLIATNNKDDFNAATGRPKVSPVAKLLGHKPTAEEINTAWELVEA